MNTYIKIEETGLSPSDPQPILRASFKGENHYPTGGFLAFSTFIQTQTGRATRPVHVSGFGDGGGAAYHLEYDVTNDTLIVRAGATGLEVANDTDLSAVTFKATIWSK